MRMEANWLEVLSEATLSRDRICEVLSWNLSYAEIQHASPRARTDIQRWLCGTEHGQRPRC
jgi:hypothetical protein